MVGHFLLRGLCLGVVLVVASCGGPRGGGARGGGEANANILLFGNGAEPEGLDPHVVTGVPEQHILSALFEGLVNLDPKDLTPRPGVAESWDVSDDSLVYTFHLRRDARWSNGDPVSAGDFLYAWRRILTPTLAGEYAYMLHDMKNAKEYNEGKIDDFAEVGCKALDDYTVEVTLAHPTPYFLTLHIHYTWFPVHQATIEKFGAMDDRNSKWTRAGNMVSNGPFALREWEPNNYILATRNPFYWNAGAVKLDGVRYFPTTNLQAEERMFRAGELHITENVPHHKVPVYREKNPEVLRTDPWLGSYFYRVNTTRPPLNDVRVRRALAMTVDRDSIVNNILRGGQIPAGFYTPPGMNGYVCETEIPYDPEGARRLLGEAGYAGGKGFPTFEILYNTQDNHKIIAEAIQQMWKKELGIDVTITNQDWKVYLDATNKKDYDIARAGWIGDFVDPINFLECFTTDNGNNRTGYSSAEYDRLLSKARQTTDTDERNRLYQEAERILLNDAPIIPIYIYTRTRLESPMVKGRPANLLDHIAFDQISIEADS